MQNELERLRNYLLKDIENTIRKIDSFQGENDMLKGSLLAMNDMLYKVEQSIKEISKIESNEKV